MYLSANRWTSAIWSEHAMKQIRLNRITADWIEEGEIQIELEGGGRGKKRKRMQMHITACNPAANFGPFSPLNIASLLKPQYQQGSFRVRCQDRNRYFDGLAPSTNMNADHVGALWRQSPI